LELSTNDWKVLRRSSDPSTYQAYLSQPEKIDFHTARGLTIHAFYYPPHNIDCDSSGDPKPPLLVKVHGGPTSATTAAFDLQIQFFTSRGFGVLDVNYGGSTGYGRAYRQRLNGAWGVVDVADCENGAKLICDRDQADRKRILIRGGSAGGFTTLASLAFRKLYRAGACYFGISDLRTWARDTHKFESRYLDKIIGPYPVRRERYLKRSPARFSERIAVPLIIFQGLDDNVVPPSQSRIVVNAMRKKHLPVRYMKFKGEGHGFHMAEHIRTALEAELSLYAESLGIKLGDGVETPSV
jgi:dipeptidyl aminopeptidase/acylaminoacyl peptidase